MNFCLFNMETAFCASRRVDISMKANPRETPDCWSRRIFTEITSPAREK